jgi:PAS domain-containing protein
VKRFILAQTIEHYARMLAVELDPRLREVLYQQLAKARRELAALVAGTSGVHLGPAPAASSRDHASSLRRQFRRFLEEAPQALVLIEPGPGLHIVEINDSCAAATLCDRGAVAGRELFDAFPDNPADRTADGVANLFDVMRAAAETGRPQDLVSQPYDVRGGDGRFVRKVWRARTQPVFDQQGRLIYMLNHIEDITDLAPRPRTGPVMRDWPGSSGRKST